MNQHRILDKWVGDSEQSGGQRASAALAETLWKCARGEVKRYTREYGVGGEESCHPAGDRDAFACIRYSSLQIIVTRAQIGFDCAHCAQCGDCTDDLCSKK